ncbi:MAG: nucleoside deaminase [Myxococcaceae bacterium]|nr:nucleoside deaminase [Myxococcaceae bacterium]MBH2006535.1 nucleoside deaminase [Myxococcaceae bacterium]
MREALKLAEQASTMGEVPIGAIVVHENQIVGRGYNRREIDHDPTAHAEIRAIQEASRSLNRWRLKACTLYVTLEPCLMCLGAIHHARLDRVVCGASETKGRINHEAQWESGILAQESAQLLKNFFAHLRTHASD